MNTDGLTKYELITGAIVIPIIKPMIPPNIAPAISCGKKDLNAKDFSFA